MTVFRSSPQQDAIFNELRTGTSHLAIIARAGCGKSTTIVEAANRLLATGARVALLSFNNDAARELEKKVGELGIESWKLKSGLIKVGTTHSVGNQVIRSYKAPSGKKPFAKTAVDGKKISNVIHDLIDQRIPDHDVLRKYSRLIATLVAEGKRRCVSVPNSLRNCFNTWKVIFDDLNLDYPGDEDPETGKFVVNQALTNIIFDLVEDVYHASLADVNVIDFDDMILLPLMVNMKPTKPYDFVFLDEAQDTSPNRLQFVKNLLAPRGRLVLVGDDRQAIYAFAGAMTDALDVAIEQLQAKVLPLNKTYRCATSVVRYAQELVPDIEAADKSRAGRVEDWHTTIPNLQNYRDVAILCRLNAPLIGLALDLIAKGQPAYIRGKSLVPMINEVLNAAFPDEPPYDLPSTIKALRALDGTRPVFDTQSFDDVVKTLETIDETGVAYSLQSALKKIEALFPKEGEKPRGILLCTYHKSKGLQWDTVILYMDEQLCPLPRIVEKAKSGNPRAIEEEKQEWNMKYVARTRAVNNLFVVNPIKENKDEE